MRQSGRQVRKTTDRQTDTDLVLQGAPTYHLTQGATGVYFDKAYSDKTVRFPHWGLIVTRPK